LLHVDLVAGQHEGFEILGRGMTSSDIETSTRSIGMGATALPKPTSSTTVANSVVRNTATSSGPSPAAAATPDARHIRRRSSGGQSTASARAPRRPRVDDRTTTP